MEALGLSPDSRALLSKLLRDNPQVVTTSTAAAALGLTSALATRRLAAWARAGWLARGRKGPDSAGKRTVKNTRGLP